MTREGHAPGTSLRRLRELIVHPERRAPIAQLVFFLEAVVRDQTGLEHARSTSIGAPRRLRT